MQDQHYATKEKKVWATPAIIFLSQGHINSGVNPAHFERSFTFLASNPHHSKKYGYVANAPHAATFTYSQLQHS